MNDPTTPTPFKPRFDPGSAPETASMEAARKKLSAVMTGKRSSSPVMLVAALHELRLFVARPTPSSVRAEATLAAALQRWPGGASAFTVTLIDVLQTPHQAIKDRIIVTPCLLVVGSYPPRMMAGELTDIAALLLFLERAILTNQAPALAGC